MFLNVIRL